MALPTLVAHWPLTEDARDAAGANHGAARDVAFAEGAAVFAGRGAVAVPHAPALSLGGADFTIAAWIRCEMPMRGVFGDVLAKFDQQRRCGLNLTIAGSSPGYCGMCDTRHVHFGIDDGFLGPWQDCGKPWPSNTLISALVAWQGRLYAGITDADRPQDAAHVFQWAGGRSASVMPA